MITRKTASYIFVVLAISQIGLGDLSPFPEFLGILLACLAAYLRFSHENPHRGTRSSKSILEAFRPLPDCRKAFIQMWIGLALMMAALLVLSVFAQTEQWWIAFLFVTAPLGVCGIYLYMRYILCLQEYNDDRTLK